MSSSLPPLLTALAALGCGLIGGVFFAFSTFIMRALARLPPPQGIAAMQSINIAVIHPLFLVPFLGTAPLCLAVAAAAWSQPSFAGPAFAAALYGLGTVGVTMAGNVPLNNELARVDPLAAGAAAVWQRYLSRWTFWNHVRTAAALLACAFLVRASG